MENNTKNCLLHFLWTFLLIVPHYLLILSWSMSTTWNCIKNDNQILKVNPVQLRSSCAYLFIYSPVLLHTFCGR